jgi:hypothetical protein
MRTGSFIPADMKDCPMMIVVSIRDEERLDRNDELVAGPASFVR